MSQVILQHRSSSIVALVYGAEVLGRGEEQLAEVLMLEEFQRISESFACHDRADESKQ